MKLCQCPYCGEVSYEHENHRCEHRDNAFKKLFENIPKKPPYDPKGRFNNC